MLLIVACSKSGSEGDKKHASAGEGSGATVTAGSESPKGSAATQPAKPVETPRPPLPKFDVPSRLDEIANSYEESFNFATKNGSKAARDRCAPLEARYHPFCYEGIAAAYLSHKGATGRDFEAAMGKIDTAFALVDCQGLGFGMQDSAKLQSVANELATEPCRSSFWDGHGYYLALAVAGEATAPCRKEDGKAPDLDACAKGSEAIVTGDLAGASCGAQTGDGKRKLKSGIPAGFEMNCSHGVGRALVFMFGGDVSRAIASCAGKNPQFVASCVSGIAFVTTLALPDRLDVAFDALAGPAAEHKAAFARGMGRALSYRRHGNPTDLASWLGVLSSTERHEAERLSDVHDKCASYFQLDKCEWVPIPK